MGSSNPAGIHILTRDADLVMLAFKSRQFPRFQLPKLPTAGRRQAVAGRAEGGSQGEALAGCGGGGGGYSRIRI